MGVTISTMRTWAATMALLGASGVMAPIAAQSGDDEAAVRAALELYMRTHATGEGEHVARAFHPDLVMYAFRDGALVSRTGAAFIAGFGGQAAADEAQRNRWIAMVDIHGTAAVAKVILDYPAVRFTDYFTLLKIDGEWKIMNKVFHADPKGTGPDSFE